MSIKTVIVISCLSATCLFADLATAQRAKFRLNQDARYLGLFQSAGYHYRNPGPCVGYYNPYSYRNSALRSGGQPQGAEAYMMTTYGNAPMFQFEQPSVVDSHHQNIQFQSAPTGNPVPATIAGADEPGDEGLSDLEAEVQSILDDEDSSSKPAVNESPVAPKAPPKPQQPDANKGTSLWPGFNEFSGQQRRIENRNRSSRRSGHRNNAYRTW